MAINKEEALNYYKNLLIIQYNNKPKAQETIELNLNALLKDDILNQLEDAFNLETAIGKQLDILGKYIGLDSFFSQSANIIGDFFSFSTYSTFTTDNGDLGFSTYSTFGTETTKFLSYNNITGTQILSDDDYRFLLKLKIIQNNIDHSVKSIDDGLYTFFEDVLVMVNNTDMTITYFVQGGQETSNLALIAFQKGVLPKPMGVKIEGIILRNKKMFSFIKYNSNLISDKVTGFTNYSSGFSKEGEMLNYEKALN
jgi:hypothetical protein